MIDLPFDLFQVPSFALQPLLRVRLLLRRGGASVAGPHQVEPAEGPAAAPAAAAAEAAAAAAATEAAAEEEEVRWGKETYGQT